MLFNVLFLCEHNCVVVWLVVEYLLWDDEWLFVTVCNVLIVFLIKIVIEEYINYIVLYLFKFGVDLWDFKREVWYCMNWMVIEFNLFYCWHSLILFMLRVVGVELLLWEMIFCTDLVIENGIVWLFVDVLG